MHKFKILMLYFVITILCLSGCIVPKAAYERKALVARNLSKRLENARKRNEELEAKIKALEIENKDFKEEVASNRLKVKKLDERLDETERMAETLKSNLNKKVEDKNKEISDIQRIQEKEINTLRAKNIKLQDSLKETLEKNTLYQSDIERLSAKINELTIENQDLATVKLAQAKEMRDLMGRINDLEDKMKKKIARMNNIAMVRQKIEKSLKDEIQAGQARVIIDNETIRTRIVTDILFDSRNISSLKKEGKAILKNIGAVLRTLKGKKIIIEGHTDNRGISSKLKEKFPSNWELSVARAVSIVRYLSEGLKIDSKILSSAGYSSFHPVVSNKTEEGRAENRRIEIVISSL